MKIKVHGLGLRSQVPKQKIRRCRGMLPNLGPNLSTYFSLICSPCLLTIGEMSLAQGSPSPLSHLLNGWCPPGNVAEAFEKRSLPLWNIKKSFGVFFEV